ncbi:MAG: hypothetical protein LDLANPLL_01689 [Turneriella sp.]|nr:hypothetical protein [Turneriella sp.]
MLSSTIPLESIQQELKSLLRLGLVMIALLLLVQAGVGWIIYKTLIKPIRNVSMAAGELSRGEFTQISYKTRRDDEIRTLVDSFNHMSSELQFKENTIRQNLASIKKKNDIAQFELNIAQKIQASIMPAEKQVGHIDWSIIYEPLYTVSGDYYDILRLSDGSVAIFIGDASGHGVPAAFLTIMAKIYFSSLVEKISDPAELLEQISVLMAAYLEMEGLYMTGFYLRIYPDNRAEYCNCIHPAPLILRKKTGTLELLPSSGFYIGILADDGRKNETRAIHLEPGDLIILYSDGITEAKNAAKKMFGLERLKTLVIQNSEKTSSELKKILRNELSTFCDGVALNDDLTIFIAEVGMPVVEELLEQSKVIPKKQKDEDTSIIDDALKLFQEKHYAQAVDSFRKVTNDSEIAAPVFLLMAESYFSLKHYDEALTAYKQYSMRSDIPEFRTLFRMTSCLAHLGKFAEAEEMARKSVDAWPLESDARAQLALMLVKQGKTEEAARYISDALRQNPNSFRYQKIQDLLENSTLKEG